MSTSKKRAKKTTKKNTKDIDKKPEKTAKDRSQQLKIFTDSKGRRLHPTGECWCGCGKATISNGAFFFPTHDKVAVSRAIKTKYGSVVGFLAAHGYGAQK